ncbi:MAG: fatty acid desaturase [Yoonia sp.]|jgi:fatty acid desaturase
MDHNFSWPTLALIIIVYAAWGGLLFVDPWWISGPLLAIMIALQASLQHEVLHGHPFKNSRKNMALVWLSLSVVIPFTRFRDTHLAHHQDALLTDPYDDPETNFLDPLVWNKLPRAAQVVLLLNNTLLGRLIIGPALGLIAFVQSEWRGRTPTTMRQWVGHLPAVGIVLCAVSLSPQSLWTYGFAVYLALSILKLRTFLEHQPAERASHRSVIVERGGLFGFLFLNNNLHVVHHMHPNVRWYRLPQLYRANKAHYLRCNGGYVYPSYCAIARAYAWRRKDPVAHPLWQKKP